MMRKSFLACLAFLAVPGSACAQELGAPADAQAMVKKAVAAIAEKGVAGAYGEFTAKNSAFVDRDIYVVVYDLNGKVLAHGANPKLVGKDMIDIQDVDGKYFVKERVEWARSKSSFWQDYKFVNPTSKKIEAKQMYCERVSETAVCAGIYKR